MAKTPHAMHGGDTLPSREEILAFIKDETELGHAVGKREIARAFSIKGGARIALKRLIKELEDEGALGKRGKSLRRTGALPPVVLADITGRDRDGDLLARPTEWDEAELGETPRIAVHLPRRPRPGQAVPGVGDRVLLRIERSREDAGPAYTGRLVKVLDKAKAQVLGVFRTVPGGGGRIAPVDKKSLGKEIPVRPGDENGAADGDLVSVTLTSLGKHGFTLGKVRERLGSLKSEKAISLVAIHAHGIPNEFSSAALAEAEAAKPAGLEGREDWRDLRPRHHRPARRQGPRRRRSRRGPTTTRPIPAASSSPSPSPTWPPMSATARALDREALERGNSVYFPDRVVPMLPERISNDLCSLRPNEDRPAMAVRIVLGGGRPEEAPQLPPHPDALARQARLCAGAGRHRRPSRRDDGAAPRHDPAPALGGLESCRPAARRARAAGPRSARAQDHPQEGRHGGPCRHPRAAGRAQADRGVHDPGQRRGGRDAGGEADRPALPRP